MNLSQLQAELFRTLALYPHLERFFEAPLRQRKDHQDWLDNDLVQRLLRSSDLRNVEKMLAHLERGVPKVINTLQQKLNPMAKDFNSQMLDTWAELQTADLLLKEKFENINALPESHQKMPDFSAERNETRYYVETKHMRSWSSLEDYFHKKLSRMRLEEKLIVGSRRVLIDVRCAISSGSEIGDAGKRFVDDCLALLKEKMAAAKTDSFECSSRKTAARVHISFYARAGLGGISSSAWMSEEPEHERAKRLLGHLLDKTRHCIDSAIPQLSKPLDSAAAVKCIVLKWEVPDSYEGFPDMRAVFRETVPKLAGDVQSEQGSELWDVRLII